MDRQHLEEQLEQDYKFLKKLEDRLRVEDDPKRQEKLNLDIDEVRNRICMCKTELQNLAEKQKTESQPPRKEQASNSNANHSKQPPVNISDFSTSEKELLSLSDLASFCAYAFPLLRWMHQPVPAKYVSWYFDKIQNFFMFEGEHIPQKKRRPLCSAVELFFRCADWLLFEEFQDDLEKIHHYSKGKLTGSYKYFSSIFDEFEYKTASYIDIDKESFLRTSLFSVLIDLRDGISYTLKNTVLNGVDSLTIAEKDILTFMLYVINFLFEERTARKRGKHLDLPEGIVLKLHDILDYTFQYHLGVKLPQREDTGALGDFPLIIEQLMHCWNDHEGEVTKP